ncbi:MAG: glycerol-3-phosphate 1-O-acyltransferase PlsY [Spirochaetales bacterium]|nr:glycerol-3-phosphate 1-O-acyltransferase PlsY [Spirochaetales bacterium]
MQPYILSPVVSYLIGAIPFSLILGKVCCGIDIRRHGSKNSGATNIFRILGPRFGIPAAALDAGKGAAAVIIMRMFMEKTDFSGNSLYPQLLAVLFAVIGHSFPVFARFRGGKGIATAAGAITAVFPMVAVYCFAIFLSITFLTGFVSVASLSAATLFLVFIATGTSMPSLTHQTGSTIFAAAVTGLVWYTHRKNLLRLFSGEENRFFFNKNQKHTVNKPENT